MPRRTTTGAFVCPDCGRSFSLERGLSRHRNYAHPGSVTIQATPPSEVKNQEDHQPVVTDEAEGFDPEMAALAAPLQQEAAKIQAELGRLNARRDQLLGRLRPIKGALDRLQTPAQKSGPKQNGQPARRQKAARRTTKPPRASEKSMDEVLDYLVTHQAEMEEGFVGAQLTERMNGNGFQMSKDRMRLVLHQLHERGTIRLVRKTQGGGNLYKLTAAGSDQGQ